MTNEKGETFFIGKDVAKALGYSRPLNALSMHVDEDDSLKQGLIDSKGRYQQAIFINESGLYSLILSSKLKQAKAFKRWVTSEVLPQIRKTGGYIPTHDREGRRLSNEEILTLASGIVGRTLQMLNAPNMDCLTATEVAKSWGMDVKSFNQMLQKMGVQYRKRGRWCLNSELQGMGLAEQRHFFYFSLKGEPKTRTYMVWTPRGVDFLNSKFMLADYSPKLIQLNLFINN